MITSSGPGDSYTLQYYSNFWVFVEPVLAILKNIFLFVILVLFVSPLVSLLLVMFTSSANDHIVSSPIFIEYMLNTLILMGGVGSVTLIIGTLTAWFVTFYSFPGRRFFEVALFLPMSIPGYIAAFTYINVFEFAGPLQTLLRELLGWSKGDYWFPEIRSLGGGILVISLSLYPYVYMLVRAGFLSMGNSVTIATTFGHHPSKILFSIAMPAVRPAIVAGVSLVLMEVIADFGTAHFLAIDTFTTGIYRSWFLLQDKYSVAVLAYVELLFVFLLLMIERFSRKKNISFAAMKTNAGYTPTWNNPSTVLKIGIYLLCSLPVILGFILPITPLIIWSLERIPSIIHNTQLFAIIVNSVTISSTAAIISLVLALALAHLLRTGQASFFLIRFVSLGYTVPNTIIAVSTMILLGKISSVLNSYGSGIVLVGTMFALLYSYSFRCLAISLGTVESALSKIPKEIDWSASLMGHSGFSTCINVHMPMIKKSLMTGFLLVFADAIKELSATLILRPFNFETVATKLYELINDERHMDAAPYALVIVLIGLISVVVLSKSLQCRCQQNN